MVRFSMTAGAAASMGLVASMQPVGQVRRLVERRHVDALDAGQGPEHVDPVGAAAGLPGTDDLVDLADDLFAVAQHHEVEEVGDGLGVVGGVTTGAHEGVLGGAIGAADGMPARSRQFRRFV